MKIEINSCNECPFALIEREQWQEDTYYISCKHPNSNHPHQFEHKIRWGEYIYFDCPEDKVEEYKSNN